MILEVNADPFYSGEFSLLVLWISKFGGPLDEMASGWEASSPQQARRQQIELDAPLIPERSSRIPRKMSVLR
jgi:hypothetical protein